MTVQQIQKLIDQTNPQNHQSKVTEIFNERDGKAFAITWNFLDDVELDSVGLTEDYIDELYCQIYHDGNYAKDCSIRMSADINTYDKDKVFEARQKIFEWIKNELKIYCGITFQKPSKEVFANTMEIGHFEIRDNDDNYSGNIDATIHTLNNLSNKMINGGFKFP